MENNKKLGHTYWFYGMSGAGKTTLAKMVVERFPHFILVDGDDLRQTLNSDLGFSSEDRTKNITRAAQICALLNSQGKSVIATMMTPLKGQRQLVNEIVNKDNNLDFLYIDASPSAVISRDPKGIYAKFTKGEIKNLSGFDAPFDHPIADNTDIRYITKYVFTNDLKPVASFSSIYHMFKHETLLEAKLRFNHDAVGDGDRWRIIHYTGEETAANVFIQCPACTTKDLVLANGENVDKWHVTLQYNNKITTTDDNGNKTIRFTL